MQQKKIFLKINRSSLKESYQKVIDTSTPFSNALNKLLLMGDKKSYVAARELGQSISDFMQKTYETKEPLSGSDIDRQKSEVLKKKEMLLERLSGSFSKYEVP